MHAVREQMRAVVESDGGRDRGALALEIAIIMPALLLLLTMGWQMAYVAHAQNVAEAAAQEGAALARTVDGTSAGGEQRAEARLDEYGGEMFTGYSADGSKDAEVASVTVEGDVKTIVPFLDFHVSETSTGPVERFVEAGE